MSKSHPNCWGPDGHVCQQPSGRDCIDCGQAAGTLWGPYWCPDCDVKRLDKLVPAWNSSLQTSNPDRT
jgi:hypothetical protein